MAKFQHGGKREGAGRPKGSLNRRTKEAIAAASDGLSPLEFMLGVLRDERSSQDDRKWAAQNAAPYCHTRLQNTTLDAEVKVDAMGALLQAIADRPVNRIKPNGHAKPNGRDRHADR